MWVIIGHTHDIDFLWALWYGKCPRSLAGKNDEIPQRKLCPDNLIIESIDGPILKENLINAIFVL